MKLTRRQWAAAATSSVAALAQTAPPAPATAEDLLKAARERMKNNADALDRQQLPMAVEPAFQFKA